MLLTTANHRADLAKLEAYVVAAVQGGGARLKSIERDLALVVGDLLGLGAALPDEATFDIDTQSPATTLSLVPPGQQLDAS